MTDRRPAKLGLVVGRGLVELAPTAAVRREELLQGLERVERLAATSICSKQGLQSIVSSRVVFLIAIFRAEKFYAKLCANRVLCLLFIDSTSLLFIYVF